MLDLVLIDSLYLAVGQHETRVRRPSASAATVISSHNIRTMVVGGGC